MKALVVIDSLVPGGAETATVDMAAPMVRAGVDLHVAPLSGRPGLQERLASSGATLHDPIERPTRRARVAALRSLIDRVQPDMVHTVLFEADLAGRVAAHRCGVPVLSSLVNDAYGREHRQAYGPVRVTAAQALDAATARLVARFHAITGHVADHVARRLRIPRSRIEVIPRGKDPSLLGRRTPERRALARAGLGLGPAEVAVLAVGRQERQKGFDTLLRATSLLHEPNLRLVIAGRDGNETAHLAALVAELGLGDRVRFLGHRSDVAELMCAADVLAFPSRWEGLGLTVVEAMALEVPIVASDLPVLRETLGAPGERALLVPSDQPGGLAAAIRQVVADPAAAAMRAAAARERFERSHTLDRVSTAMVELYGRVAVGSRRFPSRRQV